MVSPFDKDALREQAVISFNGKKRQDIDESIRLEELTPSSVTPKEEMQVKIATARMHANKEIQQYRALVETFCTGLEDLCMFKGLVDAAEGIFIDTMLESIIGPILKGNRPAAVSESLYRDMRKDMYKTLINRYIDNVGESSSKN